MDETAGPGSNSAKRARDESDDSPDAKRLRAAADSVLLDIFEEADSAEPGDLATVMRSFEEEIAALSPCSQQQQEPGEGEATRTSAPASDSEDPGQSDLGYLLEASDDDLGLPPTLLPPSSDGMESADGDLPGLGQLWGFEEENPSCYDALGFSELTQNDAGTGDGDGVAREEDLFGYPDVGLSGPFDFSDFSWRPESLPAV